MSRLVDMSKVAELGDFTQSEPEIAHATEEMAREAEDFLARFRWCGEIRERYAGLVRPGIVAVFLFRIVPNRTDVDEWLWVVVGDLPPAYLTVEECPNPASALDGYIGAMEQWVEAATNGGPVIDLVPVNVPPTPENARQLEKRLAFLDREILSDYEQDLGVDYGESR